MDESTILGTCNGKSSIVQLPLRIILSEIVDLPIS